MQLDVSLINRLHLWQPRQLQHGAVPCDFHSQCLALLKNNAVRPQFDVHFRDLAGRQQLQRFFCVGIRRVRQGCVGSELTVRRAELAVASAGEEDWNVADVGNG